MTRVKIKGIHRVRKKLSDGTKVEYHYVFRSGPRFWSSNDNVVKNGPAYFQLYQEAIGSAPLAKGKFREILISYQKSPEFKKLAPRSQKDINSSIFSSNGIDEKFGDAPIAAFNDYRIRKQAYEWRDDLAMRSERTADLRLSHLAAINTWALDRGYLVQHHLQKIKKLYKVDRSEIVWSQNEIEEFCLIAPQHVANILIVATETGLRPGDLIKLNRSHLRTTDYGLRIELTTNKRGRKVSIPVTPKMQELIDNLPPTQLQFLVGAKGQPWKLSDSLGKEISKYKKKTFIRQNLRLQDARGTAATKLFSAGLPLHNIALFMGWSPQYASRMIEIYCTMNPEDNEDVLIKLNQNSA